MSYMWCKLKEKSSSHGDHIICRKINNGKEKKPNNSERY